MGDAPEKRQRAEWQALFAPAMSVHMSRRPKGQEKPAWRERFFALYPEAKAHPGCPPELLK
ncbi:hypothetical protein ACFPMG_29195 [Azospirillum himalayense]|uniref:Uncharacterized protein n=1 Tax=Azospirillum himalayense TaxID=654847 RepID=A0ABW0GHL4_9PROT